MAPAVTCLDAVQWDDVTEPAQIAVGKVVSFQTSTCWPNRPTTGVTVHRVIAIRAGVAGPEYLTQGDANPEPDCWVPYASIERVQVGVIKNRYPENAQLHTAMMRARDAYFQAQVGYLDYIEGQCGHRNPTRCTLTGANYDTAKRLWERTERTKTAAECWRNKALGSQYPGHIPDIC